VNEFGNWLLADSPDRVRLVVPPASQYLRTVRLVAADAAVRTGLDCEEIEDFRIAIDELTHLLMASTDDFVELWFVAGEERVVAHGRARCRPAATTRSLGDLSELILASTADFYNITSVDDEMAFEVVKQKRRVLADRA
jgi:hypothetical protein